MPRKPDEIVTVNGRAFPSYSRPETHVKVMEIARTLDRGTVLDFPAGPGALAWALISEGFEVVAADIQPDVFRVPEARIVQADLNQRFPFDDDSFDYACFVEGPEHTENAFHCFREFARVLKPGGRLIATLPNYSSLENRLKALFFGTSEQVVSAQRLRTEPESENRPFMTHINRMTYPELRMALEFAGFEVARIDRDKTKWRQAILLPLAWLIMLVSALRGRKGRDELWLHESNSAAVLMGGNTLIVTSVLRKPWPRPS